MYGIIVWKLTQIPPCLGLCRKNPNKGVFGWFKFSLKVDLLWFWFGRKISSKNGEKYPISVFCSTPLRLGKKVLT